MAREIAPDVIVAAIARRLDEMIDHQRRRAFTAARRVVPDITPDDTLQPQDFPALAADAEFNFEDGQAAGLLAAKVAVVSVLRELLG